MKPKSIRERLREHLLDVNNTANDSEVDSLYREANHIPIDEETDLEKVEAWAISLYNAKS